MKLRVELQRLLRVLEFRWALRAGQINRDQLAAVAQLRERVFGPEHPDTLTARHSLAYSTGRAGDPAAARDRFAALIPVRERVLGPEHPDTLNARNQLAHWTGMAGDPAGAATSWPRCCRCASGCSARSTRTP